MTKSEKAELILISNLKACAAAGVDALLGSGLVAYALDLAKKTREAPLLASMVTGNRMWFANEQVLDSVSSIAANIAESIGRGNSRQFLLFARGSAYESVVWFKILGLQSLEEDCLVVCGLIDDELRRMLGTKEAEIRSLEPTDEPTEESPTE